MKKIIFSALLLMLTACSHVDLSLTDQIKVYTDAPVRKSALQVSLHPKGRQISPLTAYFHPFVIQQENRDHAALSSSFSGIFFNAWTEERLFTTMELESGSGYQGLSSAMNTARRRGADLLIIGKVPYFYDGHTLDDSAVTLEVDIYAAGSGELLWTMLQSGRIEKRDPDDYVYFVHETRMNDAPFNRIIRAIAKDMAIPLKAWLPDPEARYQYATTPEEVKQGLLPAPDGAGTDGSDLPPEPGATQGTGAAPAPGASGTPAAPAAGEDGATRPQISGVDLDILFDFDKAVIQQQSYPLLDALGESLSSPQLRGREIVIGGHTDAAGDAQYNLDLSRRRADAVKTYLVDRWKADPALIKTVGYGKTRPLTAGTTDGDQQRNRRVEIRLAPPANQ
ncbi:OmpA family protein [Pseudodesulfovibrio indicus]|uniref:Flagellar motor protein MotB n=1 Tax=Pseudodesulfovibrio indicus TaxID=1716143 RepID=A0A126QSF4_9BACT|nr:OmpA family protein [Pseudodesulfovibrio indicus]AMK13013.1 flagellar motor protein MotB [Pseudodesulfovibrio indicus]TDT86583.1 OOP family OmpA-OmpF porin [Pseudodesulfovibrio indicus]